MPAHSSASILGFEPKKSQLPADSIIALLPQSTYQLSQPDPLGVQGEQSATWTNLIGQSLSFAALFQFDRVSLFMQVKVATEKLQAACCLS